MDLIAMAGLPGTGKSTLARALSEALDVPVLSKDAIRAALFAPRDVEHGREQDDFCARVMYRAAIFLAQRGERRAVILDGRTFSRREQLQELAALADGMRLPLRVIECVCSPETARARLQADLARGGHPAGAQRDPALYRSLAAAADPIPEPKLVLDTERAEPPELVARARAWLEAQPAPAAPDASDRPDAPGVPRRGG
jgi:predicted kinase